MFLDFGAGIFVSIFVSYFLKADISIWLILFSVACAVLPDMDFVYFYPKRHDTKYDHKHRDIIHYPLLYLPIGTIVFWLVLGKVWAIIFLLASFLHFAHDSIGIGWGVKWLFPFSKTNYSFFYLVGKPPIKKKFGFIYILSQEKLPGIAQKYGDPNWVENIYYKWHPYAIVEMAIFVISLIILFFYLK